MIEKKDDGQVRIKFGHGDILFDCAISNGNDYGIMCFKQTEPDEEAAQKIKRIPYTDANGYINQWDVVVEFPNTEQSLEFVNDMAYYLLMMRDAMKNDGKYIWETLK